MEGPDQCRNTFLARYVARISEDEMQECLSHVRDRKRKEAVGCCRPCKEGHPSDPLLYTPATGTVGMMVILREEESLHRAVRAVPPLTIFIPSENTATTPFQGAMQPVEETTLGTLFTKGCILRPKGEDTGCRFTMQPQACPPPMFITCCKVLSITAVRGDKAKNIFYGYMPPMFENICGSAISFRGPEQFNGHCVKKTKTSFGDCHEMFTVYGNVAMRKDKNNLWVVSFKGARDVRMIAGVVKDLMGIESLFNQQTCVGGHDFNVHMAVVTSLLGKKLSVHSGCTLERIISEVSHGIEILPRLMDENNMVKFKVLSWNSVYYSLGITERSTDKHPVDNTVTVTAKGAVIIRMSWERPVEWTPKLESRLIYACSSLCDLVRGCC